MQFLENSKQRRLQLIPLYRFQRYGGFRFSGPTQIHGRRKDKFSYNGKGTRYLTVPPPKNFLATDWRIRREAIINSIKKTYQA